MTQPARFVARYSVGRMIMLLLGSILMTVLAVVAVTNATGLQQLGCGLGVILFGACMLVFLRRLFDRDDILVIDAQGFCDRRLHDGPIPWSNVTWLRERAFRGSSLILMGLRIPLDTSSQTWLQRLVIKANKGFSGNDFYISGGELAGGYRAVKKAIRQHAPPQLTERLP